MEEKYHIENIFNDMIDNICYIKRTTCLSNRSR